MQGFVALHRKIRKSAVFNDLELYRLWSICLTEASHKEHQILVGRQHVTLQRGQFLTGRFDLHRMYNEGLKAKNFVSEKTVWRWLETLQKLENVTINSTNKFSIVTVVNWNLYQFDDQKNDQQMTNKRPTNDQQMTTNNNGNKGNKGKEKDIPHRDLFEKFYETYPRREGRVDAESAWANMLKRKGDPNDVITAAYNYMVRTSADGTDKKFMKLPSSFINKDRWKEFLTPIISESRTSIPNYSAKDREAELLHKAIQNSKNAQVSMIDFGPRTD